jgi:putative membrane protein
MFDPIALISAPPIADDGPGWWIFFAPLAWFLLIATLIVFLRAFVFRRRGWAGSWGCGPGGGRYGGPTGAAEILERRFAAGDLTEEEYRERRAVLGKDQ